MIAAVINSKGGVGKTTLAVHWAIWLAKGGGSMSRVAFIDADPQESASQWLQEAVPELPVFRVHGARAIVEKIEAEGARYRHIIADGPAKLDVESIALVGVADLVLVPMGGSVLDLRGAIGAVEIIQDVRRQRGGRPRAAIVLNRIQPWTRLGKETIAAVRELGLPVCKTQIVQRTAYADASGQACPVWELGGRARRASTEIIDLFVELARKIPRGK